MGGLTAAVVALPLALAFGLASGAGALAGLYGAILLGFFAAVLGGTPTQISGPTGPMTVVAAILFSRFSDNPDVVFTIIMLGGLLQILFGFFRFGNYINLVPYPVISGFMSGIGCIIILQQLFPFVGTTMPSGGNLVILLSLGDLPGAVHFHALVPAALALAVVLFMPSGLRKLIPPPLAALIIGTVTAMVWFPDAPVISEIPSGLPGIHLPRFSAEDFQLVIRYALILGFLGSIDSLLTSLVADSMTRNYHNSNKELVGQGIGNMMAGLFGGIPGAGATMRTVVNIRSGGSTPLSGAVHALTLLLILLGLSRLVVHIPLSVLAAILLKVGIDIIDWSYLKRLPRAPKSGVVIMLATLGLTTLVDLITAVAVGMVMASVLFVKRIADVQMQSARIGSAPAHLGNLSKQEAEILEQADGRIVIFHVEGPLSFGSAKDISRMLASSRNQDVLIIDLSDVPFIDSSASITLEEAIQTVQKKGDLVLLCGLRDQVRDIINRFGILNLVGESAVMPSRTAAIMHAASIVIEPADLLKD